MLARRLTVLALTLALGVMMAGPDVAAQEPSKVGDYPSRPITIVCPNVVGGGADYFSRMISTFMSRTAKVPVNVVNMEGAGGDDALDYVLQQPADGYTLFLLGEDQPFAEGTRQTRFDFVEKFVPVVKLVEEIEGIWVRADDKRFGNLKDFVAYAKANPGKVTIAAGSAGSTSQAAIFRMSKALGIEVTYVPSGKAQITNLIGGHVDACLQKPGPMGPFAEAGRAKCLVTLGGERAIPGVPTLRDEGYDLSITLWRGFAVKRGTPEPIIGYIEALAKSVLGNKTYAAAADNDLVHISFLPTAEMEAFYKKELAHFQNVAKELGWVK